MFNCVQTAFSIKEHAKTIPIEADRYLHKVLHSQAFKDLLDAACHPQLACELLASAMSPSDPSEQPLTVLIQRALSLLAFGVKQVQQLTALCGEWLLEQLGGIPWHQH